MNIPPPVLVRKRMDLASRGMSIVREQTGAPVSTSSTTERGGLGDWLKQRLDAVGITQERAKLVSDWLGVECGCPERQEKLNALGSWATATANDTKEKAVALLHKIIGVSPPPPNLPEVKPVMSAEPLAPGTPITVPAQVPPPPTWAYGVTTVKSRKVSGVLQRTLISLSKAWFTLPHLFVDGDNDQLGWEKAYPGHRVTLRSERILPYGNWLLALMELWIRNPHVDRYAIFQDDLVAYPLLREYLNKLRMPEKGYWNLYTAPENERLHKTLFPNQGEGQVGWFESNQRGRGAVAVVFTRDWVRGMLASAHFVNKPASPDRWFKWIDGAIIEQTHIMGGKEYCHMPSLVQHTGADSAIALETPRLEGAHAPPTYASSFRGEEFVATDLLRK